MNQERFILRGLYLQEEWRCAWEACLDFLRNHSDLFGRKQWLRYQFDGPMGELTIEVWRSQRGIEASKPSKAKEGVPYEGLQDHH